jgi:hypothetical protein
VTSSYISPRECGSRWAARISSSPSTERPARCEADSPRPSSTSTLEEGNGAARWAEAAWATWWGTNRTLAGSSPGSAVARNRGARVA